MSAAKHTAGPWRALEPEHVADKQHRYWHIEGGRGFLEDNGEGFILSGWISATNARLIAAAPELLEALRGLVASLAENDEDGLTEFAEPMCKARAAIAKATSAA